MVCGRSLIVDRKPIVDENYGNGRCVTAQRIPTCFRDGRERASQNVIEFLSSGFRRPGAHGFLDASPPIAESAFCHISSRAA
jgi:hypothetical protein